MHPAFIFYNIYDETTSGTLAYKVKSLNDIITVEVKSKTVNGNGIHYFVSSSVDISKSGYTPIGIGGSFTHNADFIIYEAVINSSNISFGIAQTALQVIPTTKAVICDFSIIYKKIL